MKAIPKIVSGFLRLAALLILAIVPFLSEVMDRVIAQLIWYPSLLVIIIFEIIYTINTKKTIFKNPTQEWTCNVIVYWSIFLYCFLFVTNFYTINSIWLWVAFVIFAVLSIITWISLLKIKLKYIVNTEEQKKKETVDIIYNLLLFLMVDCFLMSVFADLLVQKFIFGIAIVIIVLLNVINAFLSGFKNIQLFMAIKLINALVLSCYLIYSITDEVMRNIVLTVTASVYGGVFTLVGVAWTIRKGDNDRSEEMKRTEFERREAERKKHIPYLKIVNDNSYTTIANACVYLGLDFDKEEDLAKLNGNVFHFITIDDFEIKNISNSIVIINGIYIGKKYYELDDVIIEKNHSCCIKTTENCIISMPSKIEFIRLKCSDIFGNGYEMECKFTCSIDSACPYIFVQPKSEMELQGISETYVINNISLPKLIQEDK